MCTVTFCSVLDVASFFTDRQDGGVWDMAKVDLRDTYRCVPIHREDWQYLGMQYQAKFYVDTCLPMGCSSSCFIFNSVSNALRWAFEKQWPDCKMFNYLDDFLILASSAEQCNKALQSFISMLDFIGFPVSKEKTIAPHTNVEFLGICIDSVTMSFMVPQSKAMKSISDIDEFMSHRSRRVHSIQKLVGKLTFLCTTFLAGKCLLASLYQQLQGVLSSEGWHWKRTTPGVRVDLCAWKLFLQESGGKPFRFIFPGSAPSHALATDASGSYGYGAQMGVLWFSGQWDSSWWPSQNIVLLELYPVYVALQLWKKQLSNSVLALKTDNIALVSILTDFYSRNKLINSLVKLCVNVLMDHNIVLRVEHIAGIDNIVPDRLSRGLDCAQYLADEHCCRIPAALLPAGVSMLLQD